MIRKTLRRILFQGLFLSLTVLGQDIPIEAPNLLPLPGVSGGISYFSLNPTQNMLVELIPAGWSIQDTLSGVMVNLDVELLRYHWWHHFMDDPRFDAYSSLNYSIYNQLGSIDLPSGYPATYVYNGTEMTDFSMNLLMRGLSLSSTLEYKYSRKGRFTARLGTGVNYLSFFKNASGARIMGSYGYAIDLGVGWKTTLFGRVGKRVRLGVDLGYSIRGFDLSEQPENLQRSDGSAASVSPIQSVSLNTPALNVSLEFGEALFGAYTPYRDPYRLGILNLSAGAGLIDYEEGVTLHLDSAGISLDAPFMATISQNFDLQIFKYNWPFRFLPQANVDLFSGMGIRFWKTNQPITLPDGWARQLTDGTVIYSALKFSPRILDIYVDHEIIYPLARNLFTRFSAGTGFASMTLYENVVQNRLIDASSFTWQFGSGLGYTIKGDGSSRVSFGVNFDYYHQAFEFDKEASNLTAVNPGERIPITFIDLSQGVVSLNIGLVFGGFPNAAQKAHEAFKKKNYAQALDLQQELLQFNPKHHNKKAVLIQKQMVEDSVVVRYYRDVRTILSQGKIIDAFALIQQGERPPGEAIDRAIELMKVEIADRSLEAVAEALKILDYELAEDLILLALKSDPTSYPIAKVLLARSYIIRATTLYGSGVYGRSLYWLRQADGLTDRYKSVTSDLRLKIGDGRLEDANEGILKEDRQMVYESMQDAKTLNPVLSEIIDEHLTDLEQAIKHVEEQQIAPMKRMAMDNLLEDVESLSLENFTPKVGMKGSLIVRYVGPPERKFSEGDYDLYVYPKSETEEIWLYLQDGVIEKVQYQNK